MTSPHPENPPCAVPRAEVQHHDRRAGFAPVAAARAPGRRPRFAPVPRRHGVSLLRCSGRSHADPLRCGSPVPGLKPMPSRAPERLVALLKRIDAAEAKVFQHRVVEAQQGAALAIDGIPGAQPGQPGGAAGANAGPAVGGDARPRGILRNMTLSSQSSSSRAEYEGRSLIDLTNLFNMIHLFL